MTGVLRSKSSAVLPLSDPLSNKKWYTFVVIVIRFISFTVTNIRDAQYRPQRFRNVIEIHF